MRKLEQVHKPAGVLYRAPVTMRVTGFNEHGDPVGEVVTIQRRTMMGRVLHWLGRPFRRRRVVTMLRVQD